MADPFRWTPRCTAPRGLVRPVRLDPAGLTGPTRGQARGRRWRSPARGWHVPTSADAGVPEQRVLEMAVLLPEGGAISGWAALRWRGAGYFDGLDTDGRTERPVLLAVGADAALRGRRGIVVSRDRLERREWSVVRGMPCATAERALLDEMRTASDIREAVVAMDMAAAAELTSISRMRRECAQRPRGNGVPQARAALDLADEESMSPNESRTRLIWMLDAGLPRPLANRPVFDLRGNLLGIADLLDVDAGLVVEYDGAAHRHGQRHRRDVIREDRFRRAGLEYVKVVGLDLAEVDVVVDRLRSTRARARFLSPDLRRWTLEAPPGWYDDAPLDCLSLDERLAYREWLLGEAG